MAVPARLGSEFRVNAITAGNQDSLDRPSQMRGRFDVLKKLDPTFSIFNDADTETDFLALTPSADAAPADALPDIPGTTTTSRTLEVGQSVTDGIDVINDEDWFRVWLVQGVTYHLTLDGSGAAPLSDPVVRFLSSAGVELARNDDDPAGGFNSLLHFTPTATGTYFISAEAFGNSIGEYTLEFTETDIEPAPASTNGFATTAVVQVGGFARGTLQNIDFTDPFTGLPVHRVDSDWYRVEVQAGEEYNFLWTRAGATGATGVDITLYDTFGNVMWVWENPGTWESSSINWFPYSSGAWFIGVSSADTSGEYTIGVNHITNSPVEAITGATALRHNRVDVYFAQAGETFRDFTSEGWNAFEIVQALAALDEFSKIANLTFSRTTVQADAEFTLVLDDNELGALDIAGRFGLPGGTGEGMGAFDGNYGGWSTTAGGAVAGQGIDRGGYGWDTMLHEFGHGTGLVHPHDDLFGSTIMDGVGDSEDRGDFDLNQGIYTVMSYNSGWETAPHGEPTRPDGNLDARYGWSGTPAAFDIAVLQQKYGANMSHRAGNDVYTLPTANQSGTFYTCIWDAGGTDSIVAGNTSASAIIDLRAATLLYEAGGGGWVSYHAAIHGGFTIANNVVIENAIGGNGSDRITGNAAANNLHGGIGADALIGGAGIDTADYAGNLGAVRVHLAAGTGQWNAAHGDTLSGIENVNGTEFGDTLIGSGGVNRLEGRGGNDTLYGGVGADTLIGGNGLDTTDYTGNVGAVRVDLFAGTGQWNAAQGDALSTVENVTGTSHNDVLLGDGNANVLHGGRGADTLTGRGGIDTVDYTGNVGAVRVDLFAGTGQWNAAQGDTLSQIENVTGTSSNDVLLGDNNANVLNGGLGADSLTGRGGADSFLFSTALGASNVDTITDYNVAADTIQIDDAVFTQLGPPGTLGVARFRIGAAAGDSDDRIIYNSANGALSYDADGNGGGAARQFATLAAGLAMTNADFVVV